MTRRRWAFPRHVSRRKTSEGGCRSKSRRPETRLCRTMKLIVQCMTGRGTVWIVSATGTPDLSGTHPLPPGLLPLAFPDDERWRRGPIWPIADTLLQSRRIHPKHRPQRARQLVPTKMPFRWSFPELVGRRNGNLSCVPMPYVSRSYYQIQIYAKNCRLPVRRFWVEGTADQNRKEEKLQHTGTPCIGHLHNQSSRYDCVTPALGREIVRLGWLWNLKSSTKQLLRRHVAHCVVVCTNDAVVLEI